MTRALLAVGFSMALAATGLLSPDVDVTGRADRRSHLGVEARIEPPLRWPIVGAVVRPFQAPASPYGAGHRGIDVRVSPGATLVAPADGVVRFAGAVGASIHVVVDHGPIGPAHEQVLTTLAFVLDTAVRQGDRVRAGQVLAHVGGSGPAHATEVAHIGIRVDGRYVDPIGWLAPPSDRVVQRSRHASLVP